MGSLDPIHNSIQWRGCVVRVIRSLPLQEDEVHGAAVALCTGQDGHRGQRERESDASACMRRHQGSALAPVWSLRTSEHALQPISEHDVFSGRVRTHMRGAGGGGGCHNVDGVLVLNNPTEEDEDAIQRRS